MKPSRLPVLFIGHGNPMNAIQENAFTRRLAELGRELPRPKAVLCVSAHWMTEGTWVTRMPKPMTIHDFFGFPQALFDIEYPAPGSPEIADLVRARVSDSKIKADDEMWGLDHGTWAVLRHVYPNADVPVVQLSVSISQPARYHFQLGQALRLRDEGVLIVGSGNIVHNLRQIRWEENAPAYDWAIEFDAWVQGKIEQRDYESLVTAAMESESGKLSIPTPDHWYPLLYVLGAALPDDTLRFEYEGVENGSISMRSFSFR